MSVVHVCCLGSADIDHASEIKFFYSWADYQKYGGPCKLYPTASWNYVIQEHRQCQLCGGKELRSCTCQLLKETKWPSGIQYVIQIVLASEVVL